MKTKKIIAILLVLTLLSISCYNFNYVAYADITSFELASGVAGDSVKATYSGNTITISGSGIINEENWITLARTIEGGNTSFTFQTIDGNLQRVRRQTTMLSAKCQAA